MNNHQIRIQAKELQELYAAQDELKALITEKEGLIKAEMDDREVEVLDLGNVIIRFKSIISSRFDTTNFKKLHSDLYTLFLKEVTSKRFCIA